MSLILILSICLGFAASAETSGGFAQSVINVEKGKSASAEYTVKTDSPINEIYIHKITPSSASVQYTGVSAPSGWTVTNNSIKPTKSGAKEVTLKFEFNVSADAPSGEAVTVDAVAAVSSRSNSGYTLNGSVTLKIPDDKNAENSAPQPSLLSALSVENGTLSPAFSPNNFIYSVKVPYEVTNLAVTAISDDKEAKITVENTELPENELTAVIVTVISAAGRQVYRINAVREARKQSGNTNLSALTVEGYVLSPPFSNDVTEYVVWVPFETESVNVTATAEDALTAVDVKVPETLKAGEYNDVTVSAKAENGGRKEYNVRIHRAAEGEGFGSDKETETDKKSDIKADKPAETSGGKSSGNIRLRYAIIGFAAGIVLSVAAVFTIKSGLFTKAAKAFEKGRAVQTDGDITFPEDDSDIAFPDSDGRITDAAPDNGGEDGSTPDGTASDDTPADGDNSL